LHILKTVYKWKKKGKVISYENSSNILDFEGMGCDLFLDKILNIDLALKGNKVNKERQYLILTIASGKLFLAQELI
jgi:hypothetical protein